MTQDSILCFINKFQEINALDWVPSVRKGPTGVGATFEYLMGKNEENFAVPDFMGIEIKTKRVTSLSYVTLFNATPDSHIIMGARRLLNLYGYPDKIIKEANVFQNSIYGSHYTSTGFKYRFKLFVNYEKKKVYLQVYDRYFRLIEEKTYWTFEMLREKLERKLQFLAVVSAESEMRGDEEYFKYTKFHLYKLKDFNTFLKLMEFGIIRVTFKMGVFRDEKRYGNTHDRGTSFDIDFKELELLYEKII